MTGSSLDGELLHEVRRNLNSIAHREFSREEQAKIQRLVEDLREALTNRDEQKVIRDNGNLAGLTLRYVRAPGPSLRAPLDQPTKELVNETIRTVEQELNASGQSRGNGRDVANKREGRNTG